MVRRVQRRQGQPCNRWGEKRRPVVRLLGDYATGPVHGIWMSVHGACFVGVIVVYWPIVQVNVVVIVRPFGKVVVVQRAHNRESKGE